MVYEWYTDGIRWYTAGMWWYTVVYGGIRLVLWVVYGGIRWYTASTLGGIRMVYGWYTDGIRMVYGWYTIGLVYAQKCANNPKLYGQLYWYTCGQHLKENVIFQNLFQKTFMDIFHLFCVPHMSTILICKPSPKLTLYEMNSFERLRPLA